MRRRCVAASVPGRRGCGMGWLVPVRDVRVPDFNTPQSAEVIAGMTVGIDPGARGRTYARVARSRYRAKMGEDTRHRGKLSHGAHCFRNRSRSNRCVIRSIDCNEALSGCRFGGQCCHVRRPDPAGTTRRSRSQSAERSAFSTKSHAPIPFIERYSLNYCAMVGVDSIACQLTKYFALSRACDSCRPPRQRQPVVLPCACIQTGPVSIGRSSRAPHSLQDPS
jgi:hypothetical protein